MAAVPALTLVTPTGTSVAARLRQIQPYEFLILFILLVLLALCLFVAQVVIKDVDTRKDARQGV